MRLRRRRAAVAQDHDMQPTVAQSTDDAPESANHGLSMSEMKFGSYSSTLRSPVLDGYCLQPVPGPESTPPPSDDSWFGQQKEQAAEGSVFVSPVPNESPLSALSNGWNHRSEMDLFAFDQRCQSVNNPGHVLPNLDPQEAP